MNEKRMGAWEAYKRYWKNGVTFQGRARRKEYWIPALFNFLINAALIIVMIILFTSLFASSDPASDPSVFFNILIIGYLVIVLFSLATLLPNLSVTVRRFHDIGKSGWWVLIPFVVPMILSFISISSNIMLLGQSSGDVTDTTLSFTVIPLITTLISLGISIWMIVLLAKDSKPGTNQWGMNPKDPNSPDVPMNKYNYEYEARKEREYQ